MHIIKFNLSLDSIMINLVALINKIIEVSFLFFREKRTYSNEETLQIKFSSLFFLL